MKTTKEVMVCDFCGKTQDEVKAFITGLRDAAICDECALLCAKIINGKIAPIPNTNNQEKDRG
jgi:ATP-dependent Clp protease ATP-binding subunit ClpX